jgi:endonuclease/exonuclease/phosphatase family metal-dependent hydrolase
VNESVRITTWNMGFHDYRPHHEEAWRYLVEVLAPDLAFVQEAVPPPWVYERFAVVRGIAWEGGTWGSAIVSTKPLKPLFSDSSRGSVVAAEVSLQNSYVVAVNIHARLIDGRVIPALTETFDTIRPLLRPPFVVGGDFNSFRSAEQRYPGYGHGPFWKRLDEEFYDCHWSLHHVEVGSFWGHVARGHELQDDHLLVDRATGERGGVQACRVIAEEQVRRLSDHGPMEAEVEFLPGVA